jgi:hypothetical protein
MGRIKKEDMYTALHSKCRWNSNEFRRFLRNKAVNLPGLEEPTADT